MAVPLPQLTSIADTTSFSSTVGPYLHQLSAAHVLPLVRGEIAFKEWYFSTNPFISALLASLVLATVFAILQLVTGNSSHVDRAWSLIPELCVVHYDFYARRTGSVSLQRLDTAATIIILWGLRMTYNFYRKGGYQWSAEDYRHPVVKEKLIPRGFYWLYSIVFLAFTQTLILLFLTVPGYVFLLQSRFAREWTLSDTVFSQFLAVLLCLEALADQQQWSYQSAKAHYKSTGKVPPGFDEEDLERGFVVAGLWSFSRHPNYLCEQTIWITFYIWSCWSADVMGSWAAIGPAMLWGVFQGSTKLGEEISAGKYEQYKEYQMRVNRFVPGIGALLAKEHEKEE